MSKRELFVLSEKYKRAYCYPCAVDNFGFEDHDKPIELSFGPHSAMMYLWHREESTFRVIGRVFGCVIVKCGTSRNNDLVSKHFAVPDDEWEKFIRPGLD